MNEKKMSTRLKRKIAIWSIAAVVSLSIMLPLGNQGLYWLSGTAIAQEQLADASSNPRSNFWRAVRDGNEGYSSVKGEGANVLVASGGNAWREARNGAISKKLPWLIVGSLVALLLYHIFHGRNRLDHAPSGRKVKRWNGFERFVHWVTAISFICLSITGLSMLFGKALLAIQVGGEPLIPKAGFAMWAGLSIQIHNILGPIFSVAIALMVVMWIWHNIPNAVDMKWFAKGGGMFGKAHPSAGRMNGGEKVWFWIVATVGVVVCVTGLVMLAPIMGWQLPEALTGRSVMQQANLLHAALAIIWTAVALGHIYIGTAGTEGALEGMTTGYVSEEWARQHHDLWFNKVANQGEAGGYATTADLEIMERENASKRIGATS